MIQEIKYNGYSAVPSDYECKDGDLSVSIGIVPEDGALRPILPPKQIMTLGTGEKPMFIHKTAQFTHYIIYDSSNRIKSIDKESGAVQWIQRNGSNFTLADVSHFNAVGNTLIAFSPSVGMYYFLWKDGKYNCLGSHIPEVALSFGLIGHPKFSFWETHKTGEPSIQFENKINANNETKLYADLSDDNVTAVTSQLFARINKMVADETVNAGRFCFPFLVRYALRLYDGSLVMHSAPILMNPSTDKTVIAYWDLYDKSDEHPSAATNIMLMACDLDYRVIDCNDMGNWTDIVKSVDVFISKPIYTYDQSGKVKRLVNWSGDMPKFIGKLDGLTKSDSPKEDCIYGGFTNGTPSFYNNYCEWGYDQIYQMCIDRRLDMLKYCWELPNFEEQSLEEKIENTFNFYKLASIDINTILKYSGVEGVKIDIPEDYLQSLVNREVLTDDYQSHDAFYPAYSYGFNSRLNLAGMKRKPFNGFPAQSIFSYVNRTLSFSTAGTAQDNNIAMQFNNTTYNYKVETHIKVDGETYSVVSEANSLGLLAYTGSTITSWGTYLFYPDTNAYEMIIYVSGSPVYKVSLKPHEFLNGAFARLDYTPRSNNASSSDTITVTSKLINTPNKIYTSEVNNPFYFPLTGINTVGTGEIMGICSAVKALSQGQFGQFPLYAFSTDGVWSLEVASDGTYKAKQPVTRDVCISSESITQLDSSVLFATDRGIMEIAGSQVQCITDAIDSEVGFNSSSLPYYGKLDTTLNNNFVKDSNEQFHLSTDGNVLPLKAFIADCQMVYDYTNQRVIVYNIAYDNALVYSMKSNAWGMMHVRLRGGINSYPEALALIKDYDGNGYIADFSQTEADGAPALLVTRPFKLGDLNVLKTIDTIIQRGNFEKNHVNQILYGSTELLHWHAVWSSTDKYLRGFHGSPYKYFRIALVGRFDKGESLYGCTVQFTPRLTNRPR